ncbi:MAG: site-specific DNA-methyltransferase [Flavobacterium sp.]|uniref:site-specific DNA-methyltransferase n=1 Tax=Flavobacterium sp. TaxID=239 RepID=UPI0022BB2F11|nr:site-specific DNA-methyltransferase [Flavobacterium sp.]MCZ8198193.1 site-specific DNA-methyltransferase [Flavobacterium sp.]
MSKNKLQKLELTWIGKGDEPKLEPRILIENPEYSYGDPNTENILIHGDNLLALKALEQDFAGKVKCIYIDPPYNTGGAFEHYDDGIEHSLWLSLIKPRLEILKNLLSNDGSIWISIDDDEQAYLKVLCDEVFGRRNFINNVIWEKKYSPQNDAKWLSDNHDFIMVYAKEKDIWRPNLLPRTVEMDKRYKNIDNDIRGPWKSSDCLVKTYSANYDYPITTPSGRIVNPPLGRCWMTSKERMQELINDNRIWFGSDGSNVPALKRFLTDVKQGITSLTIWKYTEVGHNQDARNEVKVFNDKTVFATPKPEKLIQKVLFLASNPGDIVLDSFLGSGTTSAVAHKMGRKHIGIELGEHAKTHCYPRLKAVVDGEQGGISKAVNWQGGGGFKFYTLAPSLLKQDKFGNWVISQEYNPDMLAAAMAKQEGFTYLPNEDKFWKQGNSSENDFIFTTTQFITVETLDSIHDDMQEGESILICCKAFQKECKSKYPNITLKKIPQMLLDRCEFGKDDYSLNIVNLPTEEPNNEEDLIDEIDTESVQEIRDNKEVDNQGTLFE